MKKRNFNKHGRSGFLLGALICALSFVATLLVFSLLLSLFENPIAKISLFALLAFLVSGAVSAFINAKRKVEGGTLFSLLSSLIASTLFFSVGLIVSRGKIELSLLMNVLCYILISFVFARLASIKKKRHAKFKH